MRAAPLIPPAPGKAPPAAQAPALQVAAPASAPAAGPAAVGTVTGVVPPPMPMDRDFIVRNQIIERYIGGRLPLRGAQEFERYCAANPDIIEELGLADRVHSGLRLLDASRVALPWEAKPRRWWEHPALLVASLVLAVAALVAALAMGTRVVEREATIRDLRTQLHDMPIDAATSTRTVRVEPNRTAPSRRSSATIGGSGEMADLKIDMSWSKFTAFRVTIDRMDQGRVAVLHNLLRDSNGDLHVGLNTSALGPGSYQFEVEGLTIKNEAFAQAWVTIDLQR
jgi:hypothetical protein